MLDKFDQRCQPATVLNRLWRGVFFILTVKFKQKLISIRSRKEDAFFCIELKCHMDLVVNLVQGTQVCDRKDPAAVKTKLFQEF